MHSATAKQTPLAKALLISVAHWGSNSACIPGSTRYANAQKQPLPHPETAVDRPCRHMNMHHAYRVCKALNDSNHGRLERCSKSAAFVGYTGRVENAVRKAAHDLRRTRYFATGCRAPDSGQCLRGSPRGLPLCCGSYRRSRMRSLAPSRVRGPSG